MPLATFKHIASKNVDYGAAEAYLLYAHDEFTNKPIRDDQGRLVPRADYRFTSLNCGEEDFAIACMRANLRFGKNQKQEDVKSHHYIISFDPRDKEDAGLTMDRAQALGVEFARAQFPGHQALVCTHPDGHNHSGNLHVHLEKATSLDEFRLLLLQEGIEVRESRGRFSYLTPDRTKPITARRLGNNYEKAAVLDKLAQNAKRQPVQRLGRMIDIAAKRAEGKDVGYERWAKVHNLKQAAKAWNAFEASGFATPAELEAVCEEARTEYRDVQAALRGVEECIQAKKALQFHVLQYCKAKPLRQEWKTLRSEKARINFRAQHESDLLRMEAAKRYFDQQGLQKLPSYKTLQQEIEALVQEKNQLYRRYLPAREKFRELDTMRHNLRQLLRQPEQDRQREVR